MLATKGIESFGGDQDEGFDGVRNTQVNVGFK